MSLQPCLDQNWGADRRDAVPESRATIWLKTHTCTQMFAHEGEEMQVTVNTCEICYPANHSPETDHVHTELQTRELKTHKHIFFSGAGTQQTEQMLDYRGGGSCG